MRDDTTKKQKRTNTVLINLAGDRREVYVEASDKLGVVYTVKEGKAHRVFRYSGGAVCGMPIFTEVAAWEIGEYLLTDNF